MKVNQQENTRRCQTTMCIFCGKKEVVRTACNLYLKNVTENERPCVFFFFFSREKYAGAALRILNAQTGIKNTGCRLPMEGIFYSKKKKGPL